MEENNTVQSYHEGACVYRGDGSLGYILHPEGVVRSTGQGLSHECFLKDHLGNTRVVFDSNGAVLQATDYYAFGLEHTPKAKENENRYLYNGKELQDEPFAGGVRLGWYDYGARFYDPQIGRFITQDPMAEYYLDLTPYNYVSNNPIVFIDPDGMEMSDYQLDKNTGEINLIKPTKDDHDVLYASEYDGSLDKSKSVTVEKGILPGSEKKDDKKADSKNDKQQNSNDSKESNKKETKDSEGNNATVLNTSSDFQTDALFKFVAQNSNVEWAKIKFGDNNGIVATSHLPKSDVIGRDIYADYLYRNLGVREYVHSHPKNSMPGGTDPQTRVWTKTYYPQKNSSIKIGVYRTKSDETIFY